MHVQKLFFSLFHEMKLSNWLETLFFVVVAVFVLLHVTKLPLCFRLCLVLNKFLFVDVMMLQSCEMVFCWLQNPLKLGLLEHFSLYKSRPFFSASRQIDSFKWHGNKSPGPNYSSLNQRGDFEKRGVQAMDPVVCNATIVCFYVPVIVVFVYLFLAAHVCM